MYFFDSLAPRQLIRNGILFRITVQKCKHMESACMCSISVSVSSYIYMFIVIINVAVVVSVSVVSSVSVYE